MCDHRTGTGTFNRTRTCTDPAPDCGGLECAGESVEEIDCFDECCKSVNGGWATWEDWDTCDCDYRTGTGRWSRARSCTNPAPSCYGTACAGEAIETSQCDDQCCKSVNGGWAAWEDWETCDCDYSTGTGTLKRARSCTNPAPSCYGSDCEGEEVEIASCGEQCCKTTNGVWTDWATGSACDCDYSTGTGTWNRARSCTNPAPSCFGTDCSGDSVELTSCDEKCYKSQDCDSKSKSSPCVLDKSCAYDCSPEDASNLANTADSTCREQEMRIAERCLATYWIGIIVGTAVLVLIAGILIVALVRSRLRTEIPYLTENEYQTEVEVAEPPFTDLDLDLDLELDQDLDAFPVLDQDLPQRCSSGRCNSSDSVGNMQLDTPRDDNPYIVHSETTQPSQRHEPLPLHQPRQSAGESGVNRRRSDRQVETESALNGQRYSSSTGQSTLAYENMAAEHQYNEVRGSVSEREETNQGRHYSEVRGRTGATEETNQGRDNDNNANGQQESSLVLANEYADNEHIYFDPDTDVI